MTKRMTLDAVALATTAAFEDLVCRAPADVLGLAGTLKQKTHAPTTEGVRGATELGNVEKTMAPADEGPRGGSAATLDVVDEADQAGIFHKDDIPMGKCGTGQFPNHG